MRWESTRRRESEGDGEQEMRLEANKGDREEETVVVVGGVDRDNYQERQEVGRYGVDRGFWKHLGDAEPDRQKDRGGRGVNWVKRRGRARRGGGMGADGRVCLGTERETDWRETGGK